MSEQEPMEGIDVYDPETFYKPSIRCSRHQLDSDLVFQRTPGLKQFGRWNCSQCGHFVTWCKKPLRNEIQKIRKNKLVELIQQYGNVMLRDEIHKAMHLYSRKWLNPLDEALYLQLMHNYEMTGA